MMYGVVASAGRGGLITPPGTNEGQFDFINGVYEFAGHSYTLSQCIDQPSYVTANGYEVTPTTAGGFTNIILAPFTAKLATCNWTVVIEMYLPSVASNYHCFLLTVDNASESDWVEVLFWNTWSIDCSNTITSPFVEDAINGFSVGIHKFAATRTNDRVSCSVDGNTAVSDATSCTMPRGGNPMVNFHLGGYDINTSNAHYIRSIALIDVVDDSQLPILSA